MTRFERFLEEPVAADELAEEQAHTAFEDRADAARKGES